MTTGSADSVGGPYALACGHALADRISRVGVVVGIAPMTATGMEQAAIAKTARNRWVRRAQFAMLAYALGHGQEDKFLDQALATMAKVDRDALAKPEVRSGFLNMTRGGFAQGGKAATHEAGLYPSPGGSTRHKSECRPACGTEAPTTWSPPRPVNGWPSASPDRPTPTGRTTDTSPGATAPKQSTSSPQPTTLTEPTQT